MRPRGLTSSRILEGQLQPWLGPGSSEQALSRTARNETSSPIPPQDTHPVHTEKTTLSSRNPLRGPHINNSPSRPHIHRYDLKIKVKKTNTDDEEQSIIKKALQKFFNIALQVDPSSIIPPYFALDRNDRTVPDLTSAFLVTALDSFPLGKRYFSKLSARNDKGNSTVA